MIKKRRARTARVKKLVAMLSIALCVPVSMAAADPEDADDSPAAAFREDRLTAPVRTSEGPVRGFETDDVVQFRGLPYAAPPVGPLRWQPPQAPTTHKRPVNAVTFRPTCAQSNTLGVFAAPSTSEDCLYANVYVPDARKRRHGGLWNGQHHGDGAALPVMVWIHGGGNFDGAGSDYNASKLARDGRTVVVTFNYRLNIFGFFAHPALDAEGHAAANYGLMDQQALLDWVRRNISQFGGDPNNVTIFGESAGGQDVFAHLVSPGSANLFHRGILMSGAYSLTSPTPALSAAEAAGRTAAASAGCSDQSAACLRSLTVAQLLAIGGNGLSGIVVDGTVIPRSLGAALAAGQINKVPLINGATRDEYTFFVAPVAAGTYADRVAQLFGANASAVLQRYPQSNFPTPTNALAAAQGDQTFICPARRFDRLASKFVQVHGYEFADRTAPSYAPLPGFPFLAAHTFEIQYLFPLWRGGLGTSHALNAAQRNLSDDMVSYWTTFARSGNPNSFYTPYWPEFKQRGEPIQAMQLPRPQPTYDYPDRHQCDFWDSVAQPV